MRLSLLGAATLLTSNAADKKFNVEVKEAEKATSPALPAYSVYHHFLAWVSELDKSATEARALDPYKFAEPFSRASLQPEHLDKLREAARQMSTELKQHEARAQVVISRFRREAKTLVEQGKPLPPIPSEIRDLERQRTAMLIHHYVTLRADLGSETSAQLDRYLDREFTPHIKLRMMAPPAKLAETR